MLAQTIDEALGRILEEGRAKAARVGPQHVQLWEALASATAGGKRFRPALLVATHDALGGTCPHAAIRVGAAVELLHTAFVVHDDVIDGDDLRRGHLNVSGTFRAQAVANGADATAAADLARTAGILAGDLALAAAVRTVATCGAAPEVVTRLLDLVDSALHVTAAGELADVQLSNGAAPASLADSLRMEEQKTSVYSFALPLQAGALLARADEVTVASLGEAGRSLGLAFQLADDVVGTFGDPRTTGKSVTGDLRTGKQTPLLVHARSTPEWEQISPFVGRDLSDDELDEVRRLLTVAGSRQFVEELAESHVTAARAVLDELGLTTTVLATLTPHLVVPVDQSGVAA